MAVRSDRRLRGAEMMSVRVTAASRLQAAVRQWHSGVCAAARLRRAVSAQRRQSGLRRRRRRLERGWCRNGRWGLRGASVYDPTTGASDGPGVAHQCRWSAAYMRPGGGGSSEPEGWRRVRQAQEVLALAREFGPGWVGGLVGAAPAGAVRRGATGLQQSSSGAAAGREDHGKLHGADGIARGREHSGRPDGGW